MPDIKVLIVEDDPLYALDLKIFIDELGYQLIGVVDDSDQVFDVVHREQPDLLLMDIKIKGKLNGIQIAEVLRKDLKIAVIFITSFDDRAIYEQAKNVLHYGYLIKPFNKITLESTIDLAIMALKDDDKYEIVDEVNDVKDVWGNDKILEDCVFIKRNNKLEKVEINKIIFIQSEGNYCVISTEKKKYALKMSLIKVKKMLDSLLFSRVNKRHIINMGLITSIDLSTNQISIHKISFSIGRTYKDGILKRLKTLS